MPGAVLLTVREKRRQACSPFLDSAGQAQLIVAAAQYSMALPHHFGSKPGGPWVIALRKGGAPCPLVAFHLLPRSPSCFNTVSVSCAGSTRGSKTGHSRS